MKIRDNIFAICIVVMAIVAFLAVSNSGNANGLQEVGGSSVSKLDDLTDVSTSGIADNNLIYYDSSTSAWGPISLADLSASETFVPVSSIITSGTLAAGNYTSMAVPMDNEIYQVTEAAGTPGLDVRLVYSGVTDLNSIDLYALYAGGVTAHEIAIQVYNWSTSAWDTYGYVETSTVYLNYPESLLTSSNYLSNGYVWVRLLHSDVGNPSHNLYVDYASVATNIGAGSTSQFVTDAVFDNHTANTTTAHGLNTYQLVCTVNAITNYTFDGTESRNAGYGVNTATGNKTVNIDPDLFSTGTEFSICKSTSDANTVTLDAGAGNTIDGSQTYVLQTYNQVVTLIRSAANTWKVKSGFLEQAKLLANYTTTQASINTAFNNFTTANNSRYWKLASGHGPVGVFGGISTFTTRAQIHTEVGGDALRVIWMGGPAGVTVHSASIGILGAGGKVTNLKRLTYDNNTSFSPGANAKLFTDPIFGTYSANTDFAVTAYITGRLVEHKSYYQTYKDYANKAQSTAALDITVPINNGYSYFGPHGVEVRLNHRKLNGDCWLALTDGIFAPGNSMANQLQKTLDIYNAGHTSNRADSEIDELKYKLQNGLRHTAVLIELGLNDIINDKTAEETAIALATIITKCKDAGILNVVLATVTPSSSLSAAQNTERGALNQTIRDWKTTGFIDGLLDNDATLRDPAAPSQLLAAYDSGDGINPNQAGQNAMFATFTNPAAPSDIYLANVRAKTSVNVYVNYSSGAYGDYGAGNDVTGDGTQSTPYQTLEKAWAQIASDFRATYNIYMAPTISYETPVLGGKTPDGNYNVNIFGDFTTVYSGTVAGTTRNTFPNGTTILPRIGGGFSVDAYNDYFVNISTASGYEWLTVFDTYTSALYLRGRYASVPPSGAPYTIQKGGRSIIDANSTAAYAFEIGGGQKNLNIYGVDIKGGTYSGIFANPGYNGIISRCRLTGSPRQAVFTNPGGVTYSDNIHSGGTLADVSIQGGNIDLVGNKFTKAVFDTGALDFDTAVSITDNEFAGPGSGTGYYSRDGAARITFKQNYVHNWANGIIAEDGAALKPNTCKIETNNVGVSINNGTVRFGANNVLWGATSKIGIVIKEHGTGIGTSSPTFNGGFTNISTYSVVDQAVSIP